MEAKIKNPVGERLDYTFTPAAGDTFYNKWIVVLGHGVTGNKNRPVVADTAAALSAAGFDTLAFSFAGNGNSEGDFRQATISKEVGDLTAVLNAVDQSYSKICYIGHSMGGAVGVLTADRDRRINALVSLAGMVDTKAFAEAEFGDETPDSGLMWEEESCPLSSEFMDDLCKDIVSVATQAEAINVPWLLLHGTADDVVLPRDTEEIQDIKKEAKVVFIQGSDHSFNEPAHKKQLTETVVQWLSKLANF